jgi:hypothetical protein
MLSPISSGCSAYVSPSELRYCCYYIIIIVVVVVVVVVVVIIIIIIIDRPVYILGYGLDDRGSIPDRGDDVIFSLHHHVQTDSGAHPASYPVGTGTLTPGREADHSRHLMPKLRMRGSIPPLPNSSSWSSV